MRSAEAVRHHLRFDVARLRAAAARLQGVDDGLRGLRFRLEARARILTDEADGEPCPRSEEDPGHELDIVPLRTAQAQATAALARRAALGEVLAHSGALSLVAAMAVSRWVQAVLTLSETRRIPAERLNTLAKGHVDAGRLAHRMLATLRSKAGLRSGCGQLACAVVVAELAPCEASEFLDEQIEEGLARALHARGVRDEAHALSAASAAIREGARLLERMAERAEPAAEDLLSRAERVEADVEAKLRIR